MGRTGVRTHRARGHIRRFVYRPGFDLVESRVLLANYLVTTTDDSAAAATEVGTLRWAITQANANPGADTISFSFPALTVPAIGSTLSPNVHGVNYDPTTQDWTIHVTSPLPAITDLISIDGYTQRVITNQPAANESQSVSINGTPTGGTFTLSLTTAALGTQTTTPIPYNATSDQVTAALEALSSVGAGNVQVTGGPLDKGNVTVTFTGQLGLTNVGTLTGDGSGLTGGTAPAVVLSVPTVANSGDITSDPSTVTVGFNGTPRVILDGSVTDPTTLTRTQADFPGITVETDHNLIRGLVIEGFSTGIYVGTPGDSGSASAIGNLIQGNYVGQYLSYYNPTYQISTPFVQGIGNGVGVWIDAPTNNTVGGVDPQTHNAISGNVLQGVIIDVGAYGNQVVGNLIGVLEQNSTYYFQVGNGAEGVLVESPSNAIGGAATGATNVISANGTYGIHVVGPGSFANRIQANYIGTDVTGSFVFGQGNPGNGQINTGNTRDGIFLDDSPNNLIGGSVDAAINVISGNFGAGIRITGVSATNNVILRNYIGTNLGGTAALPNFQEGVRIESANNTVGGTNSGDFNVISGNRWGVVITGVAATGNLLVGNLIGVDKTGSYDLGNSEEGVSIENDATNNTVGGSSSSARNIISGNNVGVLLTSASGLATNNLVLGNYIGTDITGTMGIGNSLEGVRIDSAGGNTIGGTSSGAGNVISANQWGVVIMGSAATNNTLQGNFIGTDITGTANLGNEVDGVYVDNSAANNLIGGTGVGRGNTIGFNIRDGVRIESNGSIGNTILSNSIFSNGALGINLAVPSDPPDEVTPNQPGGYGTGPNMLINKPNLTTIVSTSAGVNVSGTYAGAPNSTYQIQFFASTAGDPSGYGEGQTYLGSTTLVTDASGAATYTANLLVFATAGQYVTATATDAAGNTSEFSAWIVEAVGSIEYAMTSYVSSDGAGIATITVIRVGGSGGFATVDYKVANGTALLGYTPAPNSNYTVPADGVPESTPSGVIPTYYTGTVVFNAGQYSTTFTIPLLDDGLPGPTKSVNLSLFGATGAATIGSPDSATLFINNDNLPGTFQFSMASYSVNEADGSISITVLRDIPGIPVSVNFATSGGTAVPGVRYTPISGTLNFTKGQTSATFTIPIIDAPGIQGDQTVGLLLSDPTNGSSIGTPGSAILTIHDDLRDRSGPTVSSIRFQTKPGGVITALVVTFDRPVDPGTVTNLLNYGYSVRTAGRNHIFGNRDDLIIPLVYATYDSSTWSVTLTLGRGIHPPTPFLFQINESTNVAGAGVGVAGLTGNLLDGNYDGLAGSPFSVVLVGKKGGFTHVSDTAIVPVASIAPGTSDHKKHFRARRSVQTVTSSMRLNLRDGASRAASR